MLLGDKAMERLSRARVAGVGIGGVGGYVVEALARSGVGTLDLIDNDCVSLTNLNRQIIALYSTIGMAKVDAAEQRIRQINPEAIIIKHKTFFLPETAKEFDFSQFDYVVDAVDTVKAKLELAESAYTAKVPIISCMGAGNKLDPMRFEVADITETSVCPLARVMRQELKRRGIPHLKVVYSKEAPLQPYEGLQQAMAEQPERRSVPGSVAWVPAAAGLIAAGEVVRDLTAGLVLTGRKGENV